MAAPKQDKAVFGTAEWADKTINILTGCSHDCLYCYAKSMAIRFNRVTPETWQQERFNFNAFCKAIHHTPLAKKQIMYPSTHDITPDPPSIMSYHKAVIEAILKKGNNILIVTKPHLSCIKEIVDGFMDYRDKILFRFTIGSSFEDDLKFWEPGAPKFFERLECLGLAFVRGYKTSVSAEPLLTTQPYPLIEYCLPMVTDSIWIGKMNDAKRRLSVNITDPQKRQYAIDMAEVTLRAQDEDFFRQMYARYGSNPLVKYKESVKKILGLDIPTEAGLDT